METSKIAQFDNYVCRMMVFEFDASKTFVHIEELVILLGFIILGYFSCFDFHCMILGIGLGHMCWYLYVTSP